MSWPGFYALSSAWLFALVLPLVILYFLKLKRPKKEIPSLALWQQVINDQRVNSPFQKFKRNILLLLQFLLLASLILAAMQPFLRSGAERAQYIPVLIDCSASMAAVDESEGTPRIEVAKERVGKLIDDLLPDQRISLIAVSSTGRRLTSFTDNKRLLRDALRRIEVSDVPSQLEDALRMTQALTRTVPIDTVLIYSDGNLPNMVDFELPFEVNYQQIPSGGANIGITALNARRSKVGRWNVFVRLESSAHTVGTKIELLQDDKVMAEDYASLEPNSAQRLVFRVSADGASRVEVRLTPDGADSLFTDNVAAVRLPEARPLAVYCDPKLEAFRHALEALPDVDLYPATVGVSGRSQFDLLIADEPVSEGYDANVRLLVGYVPAELEKLVTINTGLAEVVDWQRNSPLLQHVQLGEVIISDEPSSFPDIQDGDYEALGYEILAHGRNAPLVLKKRSNAEVSYHLLFHPNRSTLPYRVGFPIMVANAVEMAIREAALSEVRGVRTGVLPPVKVADETGEHAVIGPDGRRHQVRSNSAGIVSGVAAPRVGRYTFDSPDRQQHIDAGLLSAQETSLSSVEEIQFRELAVAASQERIKNDRPIWPFLAMGGFGLLLAEWWYFNRRPAVM